MTIHNNPSFDALKSTLCDKVSECKKSAKELKYSVDKRSAGASLVKVSVFQAKIATLKSAVEKAIPQQDDRFDRRGLLEDLDYAKKKCDFAQRVVQFYKRDEAYVLPLTPQEIEETRREVEAESKGLTPELVEWKVQRELEEKCKQKAKERQDEAYHTAFKDFQGKPPTQELAETWEHPVLMEQWDKIGRLKSNERYLSVSDTCLKLEKILHRIASCGGVELNIYSRIVACQVKHEVAHYRKTLLRSEIVCVPIPQTEDSVPALKKAASPFAALQFLSSEMGGYWSSNPDGFSFEKIPDHDGHDPMRAVDTLENATEALLRGMAYFKNYSAKNDPASISLMQASAFMEPSCKPCWVEHLTSESGEELVLSERGLSQLEKMREARGISSIGAAFAFDGWHFGVVLYEDGTVCFFNPLGNYLSKDNPCFVRFHSRDAATNMRGIRSYLITPGARWEDIQSLKIFPIADRLDSTMARAAYLERTREAREKELKEGWDRLIEDMRGIYRKREEVFAKLEAERLRPRTVEDVAPSAATLMLLIDLLSKDSYGRILASFMKTYATLSPEIKNTISNHMLRIRPELQKFTQKGERPFRVVKEEGFEAGDRARALTRACAEELIRALDMMVSQKRMDTVALLLPLLEKMSLDPRDVPQGMNPNIAYALFGQLYHTCNDAFKAGRTQTNPNTPDFGRQGFAEPGRVEHSLLCDAAHKVCQDLWRFWWPRPAGK